jgi:hypothetical protein
VESTPPVDGPREAGGVGRRRRLPCRHRAAPHVGLGRRIPRPLMATAYYAPGVFQPTANRSVAVKVLPLFRCGVLGRSTTQPASDPMGAVGSKRGSRPTRCWGMPSPTGCFE